MEFFETKVIKVKKEKKECEHKNVKFQCCTCGKILSEHSTYNNFKNKKGNWVNGENLDKIMFPCFCSYIVRVTGEKRYGRLDKAWVNNRNEYQLSSDKQEEDLSVLYSDPSLKKLMINLKIRIEKGKVIIFEEA